jgi:hypothetical protein
MAAGAALVLLSMVASIFRAVRFITIERLIAAGALLALVWITGSPMALAFAAIVVALLVIALVLERGDAWPEPD